MVGYRTVLIGLLMAIGPAALGYLAGIDWTHYVNPTFALFISGAIMVVMRYFTTTPIASK